MRWRLRCAVVSLVPLFLVAACGGEPTGLPDEKGDSSVPGAVLGSAIPFEFTATTGTGSGVTADDPGPGRIPGAAGPAAGVAGSAVVIGSSGVDPFAEMVDRYRPNELGRVLILEYHHIGDEEERWTRERGNFRKDLEMLYARGYRAVNLKAYLTDTMNLPPGTSPVIFTFDDSSISQFKWKEGQPDPESAVGIMMAFRDEHPDFGLAGTFYVNFTPVPFREEEHWREKIRFLVRHGFEIANHTAYHDDLSALADQQVQEALAEQVRRLRELLPDYDGGTLALPFGAWPQNRELAVTGEAGGVRYQHMAVLLVGADPAYSVYDHRHDPLALPRVQAIASEFERWMDFLGEHRYVSDGDPLWITVPDWTRQYLDPERSEGKQLRFYSREN